MRIAILDDDLQQLELLVKTLSAPLSSRDPEISCVPFSEGELLRRALRRETFDLLILDWNLPDLDGVDLLRWMRNERRDQTPVLMLSSRGSERDVVGALSKGADDYMVKPIRPLELRARLIRLHENRANLPRSESLSFGDWHFKRGVRTVRYEPLAGADDSTTSTAEEVQLTEREFTLALALFRNLGRPVSRSYLTEKAGTEVGRASSRSLDSHVYRLRVKLRLDGSRDLLLITVYGRGYQLEPVV